jgi:hypothetical protein
LSTSPVSSSVVDSEVWPNEITLCWQDRAGQQHSLQKLTGEPIQNVDDPNAGPISFNLESYGQGETARLSKQAEQDPLALLDYLDKFVAFGDALLQEKTARDTLLQLQTKIEEAEQKVALIPQYARNLETTQQQLAASAKANAEEVIKLQRNLAHEREIRIRVIAEWDEARGLTGNAAARKKLLGLAQLGAPADMPVGGAHFEAILAAAGDFAKGLHGADAELEGAANKFDTQLKEQVRLWKLKDQEAALTIESKRKELEAKGVRLDMAFIQKLAKDEANFKKSIDNLSTWKPHLDTLRAERKKTLAERWATRDRVGMLRDAFGRKASETLKQHLSDLSVSLKYVRSGCSPDAAALIQETMGWRTNQVPKAALLTEKLTVPGLLGAVESADTGKITALAYPDGTRPFDAADAKELIERLKEPRIRCALERCEIHDLPRLLVTKKVEVPGGAPKYVTRDFGRLSLGQQQSILLTLLLSSDGNEPLIIDQPEDNLDGEFIYSSFVPVLRHAKERRQIIVVTHNPNIAVLGDAELIVVLKSQSDRGTITARGSIDERNTREAACGILEGAREAFVRRARVYGVGAGE